MDLTQDALGEKEQVRIDNLRDGEEVHQVGFQLLDRHKLASHAKKLLVPSAVCF